MRSAATEVRAVMDPALVGIAMLVCLGLAVGKNIGKDPNTGCGKGPAVAAGGGAVAAGTAISKAGLLGTKAATVGAKAVGVGATATLADDVARVGATMSDDVARVGATMSEDVAVGATMSDDVARTAASGGRNVDDGADGAGLVTHTAHVGSEVARGGSSFSETDASVSGDYAPVSGKPAPCTHANPDLRGLSGGAIPTAFGGAIVQPVDPATIAWSSDQLWRRIKAAVVVNPCDPTIDSLDLTPMQRAVVFDTSGKYLVLVLEGGKMLVEFTDGRKLLLRPKTE